MEFQDDVAPGLDPARTRMTAYLVTLGWNEADARVFAREAVAQIARRREFNDEVIMVPELAKIILDHNPDPHDTDVLGTVFALLDYIWARVL
jgi:hypothetical protein